MNTEQVLLLEPSLNYAKNYTDETEPLYFARIPNISSGEAS